MTISGHAPLMLVMNSIPMGIFEFNITKLLNYIHENPDIVTLKEVAVDDFAKSFSSINESHLDSVKFSPR